MSETDSIPDFRKGMIRRRLRSVRKLLLVLSGKGGVGKSLVSATVAALLADEGYAVGLMDADIYGPSSTLLLGVHALPGEGKQGLTPPTKRGIRVMSVDLFAPGRPVPLTGAGARQVILEMLALTNWGDLDCLVVDMPPATGDIMMTLTSLGRKEVSAVVVTTPDKLSLAVAHRALELLHSGKVPIAGVLENMHRPLHGSGIADDEGPRRLAKEFDVEFLGELPFDVGVRSAVEKSDIRALLSTRFAKTLRRSVDSHLRP